MPPPMLTKGTIQIAFALVVLSSGVLVTFNLYQMGSVQHILSVEYKVFGRVQGVFFRKYTKDKADQLRLFGWVRNERDGTVSGVVQGPEDNLNQMKVWLTHKGSPQSRIDKCQFTNERQLDQVEFSSFTINR